MTRAARTSPAHARLTPRRVRAFTLIEVITAIVIMSIIAGVASRILFQAFGALNDASSRATLSAQLAAAMERVTSELHSVAIVAASSPATPDITACTATSISFNTPAAARTLTLSGSNLLLSGSAKANSIIASNISSITIQTYDGANAAIPASPSAAQIATIRRVQITLVATSGGFTETLRTTVFVRCMALGSGSS